MNDRIILHCDANNFYASVECVLNPALKDKPIAVTGATEERSGIVLAKNYQAKKHGVQTGDVIWQAKQKCPNLVCIPPHHDEYIKFSKQLINIYSNYTDRIESFGIDECWLDVSQTAKFFGTGEQIANIIKERVKKEIGITISVGVSFCKLFAKLGSDMKKPDGVTLIMRNEFKNLIYPLPLKSIVGIGKRLEKRLNGLNIFKLGDMVKTPTDVLSYHLGIVGTRLKEKLMGNDTDAVHLWGHAPPIKSIGNGTTTLIDIKEKEQIANVIRFLSEEVATRLRNKNLVCSCIHVSIRKSTLEWIGKSHTFLYTTNTAKDISSEAQKLISTFWNYTQFIRSLRICVTSLAAQNQGTQINLFEDINKKNKLNAALDSLRKKYGYQIITPCINYKNSIISNSAIRV